MAIGPTFGSLLIHTTHDILSVFYVATSVHCAYAVLVWFVIPESLTLAQRRRSRAQYARDQAEMRQRTGVLQRVKRLFSFLTPLAVIMPQGLLSANPLKPVKRDWNLTLVVIAYGFTISLMVRIYLSALLIAECVTSKGSVNYKLQYAASAFNWTSEEVQP